MELVSLGNIKGDKPRFSAITDVANGVVNSVGKQ